jgi:hypothetical protein
MISALGCCTAAPGSNPARHPTPRASVQQDELFTQTQEDTQQAKTNPRMNIVLMDEKYKINKKSAGNGTKPLRRK